jgi:hypothetical protein
MTLTLLTVLISGCAKISGDTYCDLASPMYFDNQDTVEYLLHQDKNLLLDVLIHNETHEKVCK